MRRLQIEHEHQLVFCLSDERVIIPNFNSDETWMIRLIILAQIFPVSAKSDSRDDSLFLPRRQCLQMMILFARVVTPL